MPSLSESRSIKLATPSESVSTKSLTPSLSESIPEVTAEIVCTACAPGASTAVITRCSV